MGQWFGKNKLYTPALLVQNMETLEIEINKILEHPDNKALIEDILKQEMEKKLETA